MTRRRGSRKRKNPPEKDAAAATATTAAAGDLQPITLPARRLRILWIGTKPPLPAVDGGRLVALHTLRALAEAGHEVVFVSPSEGDAAMTAARCEELRAFCEPVLTPPRQRPWLDERARAVFGPQPVTIRRHLRAKVHAAVAGRLATGRFDIVHCEQLHAVAQAAPAFALGVPVVLRQHNVESDLWRQLASELPWTMKLLRPLALLEAARVRRYEAWALRRVAATIALTQRDADRLAGLAKGGGAAARLGWVRAPFPPELPAAAERFAGEPAVVLFGNERWLPNRLQAERFVAGIWPRVRAALPGARLHLFTQGTRAGGEGIDLHPAPSDSRDAFAAGSVLVVPLRVGSGVRMKILEAWARGVAVVATPAAAAGLEAEDGRELLLAEDGEGFARALGRLLVEPDLAPGLIERGRRALAARHSPAAIAAELAAAYRDVISNATCARGPSAPAAAVGS